MSGTSLPLEPYAGPLDLLLDEVRRQNISLETVALAPLVSRYLDHMQRAARARQPLSIDWILLAATLIQWKSRALLAPETDSPTDPIREELLEQLRAHRQELAGHLSRRQEEEAGRFSQDSKQAFRDSPVPEEPAEPAFVSVWDLREQARELACWASQQNRQRRQWPQSLLPEDDDITVAEMSEYVHAQLAACSSVLDASRLLAEQPNPLRRVYLFLAMLEMARAQQLRLFQPEAFASIVLAPPLVL